MINFKIFNLGFLIIFIATFIAMAWLELSYIYLLIEICLFFIVPFAFSFFIQSNFYVKALCKVPNTSHKIAITFDDGPIKEITPQVLDILKRFDAKASFFCVGKNLANNHEIVMRMQAEGHQIGNHTYSHSNLFGFYSSQKIIDEMRKTSEAIENITGEYCKIFRPPFGITNPEVRKAIQFLDFALIGWNVRTYDGTLRNKKLILANAIRNLKPGDIVLFHDNHEQIIEILEQFLQHVSRLGFKAVRIDELKD